MGALARPQPRRVLPLELIIAHHRLLHPFLKAYGLGLLSFLGPRVLSTLLAKASRKRNSSCSSSSDASKRSRTRSLRSLLKCSFALHRFPAFCGVTIGGTHVLRQILSLSRYGREHSACTTFVSAFVASATGHALLNSHLPADAPAGRTLDLTFFAVVRAADVIVGELWTRSRSRKRLPTLVQNVVEGGADSAAFALASAAIMYSWFYYPERLPGGYRKWITSLANADSRLIDTLRDIRNGRFVYGQKGQVAEAETDSLPPMESYSRDLGLPKGAGDPAVTKPIPCFIVHGGRTPSCEHHALYRFTSSFRAALPLYLGLNALSLLVPYLRRLLPSSSSQRPSFPPPHSLLRVLTSAARSSAFLGTFVASLWYTICLTRTRLLPRLLPHVNQQHWEQMMVQLGCLVCGWSILWETPARRKEIVFFVMPKALATLGWPVDGRWYNARHRGIETGVFAAATAAVFAAAVEDAKAAGGRARVRGVFGKMLRGVMAA